MADRVASDSPAVTTARVELTTSGATDRPVVRIPADADVVPPAEVCRLVLDDTEYHAPFERALTGDAVELSGAYDTPSATRAREGDNRLRAWVERAAVRVGGSVLLDEVTPEFKYGLRAPGERTVYEATDPPDESLSSIAEDLDL
jgi:hypothetical protein